MKAILEFNLDEPDDRLNHNQCVKANNMAGVLWELAYNSKKQMEWELDANDKLDRYEVLDMVYKRLFDLMEEHDVNIERLYI